MFTRRNPQGGDTNRNPLPQILAANVDRIICITTPASPPFRPRFIDRVLLQADASGIPALIVCNKNDLCEDDIDIEERFEDYKRIGFTVLRVSAKTGAGMDELVSVTSGRLSVLVGQSGVGKSSLIKALAPGADIRIGPLNEKYDRGNHTTTISTMIDLPLSGGIIDTPGIRLFIPGGIGPDEVIFHLKEFAPLAGTCTYGSSCSHESEPGCKIMEAVAAGVIHEDRYESFLRIRGELSANASVFRRRSSGTPREGGASRRSPGNAAGASGEGAFSGEPYDD
jgi:ribosome biogenesis GTPase